MSAGHSISLPGTPTARGAQGIGGPVEKLEKWGNGEISVTEGVSPRPDETRRSFARPQLARSSQQLQNRPKLHTGSAVRIGTTRTQQDSTTESAIRKNKN
jgi:hypothetical protein